MLGGRGLVVGVAEVLVLLGGLEFAAGLLGADLLHSGWGESILLFEAADLGGGGLRNRFILGGGLAEEHVLRMR